MTAAIIVALNLRLAWQALAPLGYWIFLFVAPLLGLLLWITASPWLPKPKAPPQVDTMPEPVIPAIEPPHYKIILLPLDHSDRDRTALAHASALARQHQAKLFLLHVEEGVTSQVYGELSETAEVEEGNLYLTLIAARLKAQGIEVEIKVVHRESPRKAIIEAARIFSPNLIIMGAHGHSGIKDLIFGSTIDAVRHGVACPVLIVR